MSPACQPAMGVEQRGHVVARHSGVPRYLVGETLRVALGVVVDVLQLGVHPRIAGVHAVRRGLIGALLRNDQQRQPQQQCNQQSAISSALVGFLWPGAVIDSSSVEIRRRNPQHATVLSRRAHGGLIEPTAIARLDVHLDHDAGAAAGAEQFD